MPDDRNLEQALQDIEADVRVLTLIDEAQPDKSGWAFYNLPREEGFELLRIPVRDQYVSIAAMCRLKASVEKALEVFYRE